MYIRVLCFLLSMSLLSACQQESPGVGMEDGNQNASRAATNTSADQGTGSAQGMAAASKTNLEVYKDPNCGCCAEWITYMDERGYSTKVQHPDDLSKLKLDYKIQPQYQSCHTAVSKDGFVFEGHIPAKYIDQFLAETPEGAIGLAVPGMPLGSPGMEVEDRFMAYDVLLLKEDGSSEVYGRVNNQAEQY